MRATHATFMVASAAFGGSGFVPVTFTSFMTAPELASTVGAANGTTAPLLADEHTREALGTSKSADQHEYSVPPTNGVGGILPSASEDTCTASPEVVTTTHPVVS